MTPIRPDSRLTTRFGHDTDPVAGGYRFHRAIDRAGGDGHVYCPMDARKAVIERDSPTYGTLTRLFYDGFEIRLAHCRDFFPDFLALEAAGKPVPSGMVLALEGSIGKSTGPHTHIELVATAGTRAAWIDQRLQAAGLTMGHRYTAQDLKKAGNPASIAHWMKDYGCRSLGPHECWCWDRRTNSNAIWIDPLAVGL